MTDAHFHQDIPWTPEAREIADWIIAEGLRGTNERDLLDGLCKQLTHCGIALVRAHVSRRTLHPIYGAYASQWRPGEGVTQLSFGRDSQAKQQWQRSPFVHMIENKLLEYRVNLGGTNEPLPFSILQEMREEGATEYVGYIIPWGRGNSFQSLEGVRFILGHRHPRWV